MALTRKLLSNLRGAPGYNATGAAEDDAAIAAFVAQSAGATQTGAAVTAAVGTGTDRLARRVSSSLGVVVVTMDDAYIAMDTLRQMMDDRGQHGTFCITPGLMGIGKVTEAQILTMVANGHEIAAHSQTHPNFTTLTPAQIATELSQPKDYLENLIGEPVTTFAYPFGTSSGGRNATTDPYTYPLYERVLDTANLATTFAYPRFTPPPGLIPRTAWNNDTHPALLEMVRNASKTPVIVPIFCHNFDTDLNPTTAQATELLDLCASLGVPVVTAKEAFGSFHSLANASFDTGTIVPWRPFTSGGGTYSVETVTPPDGMVGTHAVRLSAGPSYYAYVRQLQPVTPGRTYVLSCRARVVSGTIAQANDAFARVEGYTIGAVGLPDTVVTPAPLTSAWQKLSIEYTAPQDAAFAYVDLVANDIAVATTVDFTHVWFGPKSLGDLG